MLVSDHLDPRETIDLTRGSDPRTRPVGRHFQKNCSEFLFVSRSNMWRGYSGYGWIQAYGYGGVLILEYDTNGVLLYC